MSTSSDQSKCNTTCWLVAAAAGLFTFIMLKTAGHYSLISAIILGLLVFGLLGLLLKWLFCASTPAAGAGRAAGAAAAATAGAGAAMAASGSSNSDADAKAAAAAAKAEADAKAAADAAKAKADADAKAAADAAKAKADADAKAAADAAKAKADADAKAAADAAKAKADADAKAAADAKASKAAASGMVDYDGDGKLEGADEGTKPEMLTAPRAGGADDLKKIKGIGPKLEGVCNSMGVYHFDQIAAWTADEVAWVNANLAGFKGRVTRDNWIEQAKLLAAGGETEFSARVEKGSVY